MVDQKRYSGPALVRKVFREGPIRMTLDVKRLSHISPEDQWYASMCSVRLVGNEEKCHTSGASYTRSPNKSPSLQDFRKKNIHSDNDLEV